MVIVLIIVLVATQAYGLNIEDANPQDHGKDLLTKLQNSINLIIKGAWNTITVLLEDVKELAKKIVNNAKKSINQTVDILMDILMKKIGEIKQKAIYVKADIAECSAGYKNALKNLPKDLIFNLNAVSCITDKFEELQQMLTDTSYYVTSTNMKIQNLTKDFNNNCETGVLALLCITKVLAKISLAIIELILNISSEVHKAFKYFATLETSSNTCAAIEVTKTALTGGNILAIIVQCIVGKMHERHFSNVH